MTLVSSIIEQGFREYNGKSVNASATPVEAAEALDLLQNLVLSAVGNEAGYVMEDWNVTAATAITKPSGFALSTAAATAWTVAPQARVVCNLAAILTITLDPQPQDGQRWSIIDAKNTFDTYNVTVNPNNRKFEGTVGNATLSTEGLARQWFYRGDLADWKRLDTLLSSDEMPFPEDFDDYFIISLAMRLCSRVGREIPATSVARRDQQKAQFISRYMQTRLRDASPLPMGKAE